MTDEDYYNVNEGGFFLRSELDTKREGMSPTLEPRKGEGQLALLSRQSRCGPMQGYSK